jgi:hypothetical protein
MMQRNAIWNHKAPDGGHIYSRVWFGLYLVDHSMDPGGVLTTFYACLGAIQSIETVLPQWLVLAKGISAAQT